MPELITSVWVKTTFIGFHRWKDAPEEVAFLRTWHRHTFHVKMSVVVEHDNRDIEFIGLKQGLDRYLESMYHDKHFEESCEQIAKTLLTLFNAAEVQVSEDGENGATVSRVMNL